MAGTFSLSEPTIDPPLPMIPGPGNAKGEHSMTPHHTPSAQAATPTTTSAQAATQTSANLSKIGHSSKTSATSATPTKTSAASATLRPLQPPDGSRGSRGRGGGKKSGRNSRGSNGGTVLVCVTAVRSARAPTVWLQVVCSMSSRGGVCRVPQCRRSAAGATHTAPTHCSGWRRIGCPRRAKWCCSPACRGPSPT